MDAFIAKLTDLSASHFVVVVRVNQPVLRVNHVQGFAYATMSHRVDNGARYHIDKVNVQHIFN